MKYRYIISKIGVSIQMIFIAVLMMLMSSCDSLLDIKPTDQIDGEDLFSSVDRLEKGVLGVYADWYPEHTIRIASLMTDECRLGLQNSGVDALGQNVFRWTYTSSDDEILAPWQNSYQVIGRVNYILKGMNKVPIRDDEEKERIAGIEGELLGIRAFMHFELYRMYSYSGVYDAQSLAIPYIVEPNIDKQPSRPTVENFFDLLWKDLQKAENLQQHNSVSRLGLNGLNALHARISLYTGRYDDAELYASKVIEKMKLSSAQDFALMWKDKSEAEVIFKLQRNNMSTIRPGDIFYNINSDKILFTPSSKLTSAYDKEHDIRYLSWFKIDEEEADEDSRGDLVIKYEGDKDAQNRNDVKIFRVGEMYLIRAEARLNQGDNGGAASDLHTLRMARISGYKAEIFRNKKELSESISEERFKELPYEGHRFFDLRRRHEAIHREVSDVDPKLSTLLVTDLHYNIPIPQSEVMANPNIRPNNKGW